MTYVITHQTNIQHVITDISKTSELGFYMVESMVKEWYNIYSEFTYDSNGKLVFYHYKTRGYWEVVKENLDKHLII